MGYSHICGQQIFTLVPFLETSLDLLRNITELSEFVLKKKDKSMFSVAIKISLNYLTGVKKLFDNQTSLLDENLFKF